MAVKHRRRIALVESVLLSLATLFHIISPLHGDPHTSNSTHFAIQGDSITIPCFPASNITSSNSTSISEKEIGRVIWHLKNGYNLSFSKEISRPHENPDNNTTTSPALEFHATDNPLKTDKFEIISNFSLLIRNVLFQDGSEEIHCEAFALNNTHELLFRHSIRFIVQGEPDIPTNVTLLALLEESLNASWSHSWDGNSPLVTYELLLNETVSGFMSRFNVSSQNNQHIFSRLRPYTQYAFHVKAYNKVRSSAYSSPVNETTLPGKPGEPMEPKLNVIPGQNYVNVSTSCDCLIEAQKPGGGQLKGPFRGLNIKLEASQDSTTLYSETFNDTDKLTITIPNLEPYKSYYIYVKVFNGRHYGPRSLREFQTLEGIPDVPQVIKISEERASSFVVWWTLVDASKGPIINYMLQVRKASPNVGDGKESFSSNENNSLVVYQEDISSSAAESSPKWKVNANLTSATQYWVRVAACTRGGCSAFSGEKKAETGLGPPSPPKLASVKVEQNSGVLVNWTRSDLLSENNVPLDNRSIVYSVCWVWKYDNISQNNAMLSTEMKFPSVQVPLSSQPLSPSSLSSSSSSSSSLRHRIRRALSDIPVCMRTQKHNSKASVYCHCSQSNPYQWTVVPWNPIIDITKQEDVVQLMTESSKQLKWLLELSVSSIATKPLCKTKTDEDNNGESIVTTSSFTDYDEDDCYQQSRLSERMDLPLDDATMEFLLRKGAFQYPRSNLVSPPPNTGLGAVPPSMDGTTLAIIIVSIFALLVLFILVVVLVSRPSGLYHCLGYSHSARDTNSQHQALLASNCTYNPIDGIQMSGADSLSNGSSNRRVPRGNGTVASNRCTYNDVAANNKNGLVSRFRGISGTTQTSAANPSPPTPCEGVPLRMLSFSETKHPAVLVDELAKHIASMHANDDAGYQSEFEAISQSVRQDWPTTVASLPENTRKNRYSNVLAYDHTRVALQNILSRGKTDYINANFIDGYHRPRAFIATQGPLESTCDDFWQMIWEQHSNVIVMISNFVERGRRKCDMYWSSTVDEPRCYGGITVRLQQQIAFAYYTLRVFTIRATHKVLYHSKKGEKERTVYHYQYTEWQDFDVPRSPLPVLSFISHTLRHWNDQCGPIVVHCSAGVGRTGTYICVESMIRQMITDGRVNVRGFLQHIRQQRMKLVQTEQQYAFIHDALREHLVCSNHEISIEKLPAYISTLKEEETCGCTALEKQYELCVEYQPSPFQYSESRKPCNTKKIRSSILPVDHCRVNLPSELGVEGSNYINASHIQGFYHGNTYIITQHPLSHTEEDFWRMVWDENSPLIVILSSPEMPIFWPDELGQSKEIGWLRVTSRGRHILGELNVNESEGNNDSTLIYCYEFLLSSSREDYALVTRLCHASALWPSGSIPVSPSSISNSESFNNYTEENPSGNTYSSTPALAVETCRNHLAFLQLIRGLLPSPPSSAVTSSTYTASNETCGINAQHNRVLASVKRATSHIGGYSHSGSGDNSTTPLSATPGSNVNEGNIGSLTALTQSIASDTYSMILVDDFGGARCGAFCALNILMQQMLCHATVDVYLVMKTLHLQRPGLFQSYNDLGFIYHMLEIYLHKFKSSAGHSYHSQGGSYPSSGPNTQSISFNSFASSSANVTLRRSGNHPASNQCRASALEHSHNTPNPYLSLPRRIQSYVSAADTDRVNAVNPTSKDRIEVKKLNGSSKQPLNNFPQDKQQTVSSELLLEGLVDETATLHHPTPGLQMTTSLYNPPTESSLYTRRAPCSTPPPCSHSRLLHEEQTPPSADLHGTMQNSPLQEATDRTLPAGLVPSTIKWGSASSVHSSGHGKPPEQSNNTFEDLIYSSENDDPVVLV